MVLTKYDAVGLGRRLPNKPNRGGSHFREQDSHWRSWHCSKAADRFFFRIQIFSVFQTNTSQNILCKKIPTIVQSPLQDGRRARPSISDPCESQNLDLVKHILPQTSQLDAVGGVPFHRPEMGCGVRVLLLIHHLIRR